MVVLSSFYLSLLALPLVLPSLGVQAAPFNNSDPSLVRYKDNSFSTLVSLSALADPPIRAYAPRTPYSVNTISDVEVATYIPYTRLASASYCPTNLIKNWTCGQHCQSLPSMVVYDAGGNNQDVPYWYVGYLPLIESAVVAHQGTTPSELKSVLVDANYFLDDLDTKYFPKTNSGVQVHKGFADCHGKTADRINAAVKRILQDNQISKVVTVGHSLGGALAVLDAMSLQQILPSTTRFKIVTFGQPRVGNQEFADHFDAQFSDVSRLTHKDDVVPILPGRFLGFHHSSGERHIDPSGQWWMCTGQDNEADPQCSTGEVSNILEGSTSDHTGLVQSQIPDTTTSLLFLLSSTCMAERRNKGKAAEISNAGPKDLKESLAPITDTSSAGSAISAVGSALAAPFSHVQRKSNASKLLSDLAPKIMTPRMITAAASSSRLHPSNSIIAPSSLRSLDFATLGRAPMRLSLGSRRITSRDLQIVEATDELLAAEIPDPEPNGEAGNVSLLRGFRATIPSSEQSKTRRRKTRNVDAGHLGLAELGKSARGMLEDGSSASVENQDRKGKRKPRQSFAATVVLGRDELDRQKGEILLDKENIHVRRSLINAEIDEISQKIVSLDAVRNQLQQSLLRLHEEELELDEELENVFDRLAFEEKSTGAASAAAARNGKRRKGPAFLPSEHDDLPPGVAFMTLPAHSAPITALDFSEPYGVLVSAGLDEATKVWDLCTGEEIGRLRGHAGAVKCMQVDDSTCVTGGADGTIRLWDLRRAGEDDDSSTLGGAPEIVNYSDAVEEGRTMSGSSRAGEERQSATDGPCVRVLEGHSKGVSALYFEDVCLVSGAADKTIRQWDLSTGQCVLTMDILWAMSHPPSSSLYSSASLGSSSVLPNITASNFAYPTPPYADGSWEMYQDFVGAVQFWGYALVSGSGDGAVRMWDMRTGQAHRTLLGHTAPVTCLQFDEMYVVSGGLDKNIRIWDIRTGSTTETLKFDYPVTDLQFDTRKVVAACGENGIKIYNRTTFQQSTLVVNGHTKPVEKLRYIDRYLVSGGRDNTVKIWSL